MATEPTPTIAPPAPSVGAADEASAWTDLLRRGLDLPVHWVPRAEAALGPAPQCRALDRWARHRPECAAVHRSARSAGSSTSSPCVRVACPLGGFVIAAPVMRAGTVLGWLECGPLRTVDCRPAADPLLRQWGVEPPVRHFVLGESAGARLRTAAELAGVAGLVAKIAEAMGHAAHREVEGGTPRSSAVAGCLRHIECNLGEELRIGEMAARFGLSADRFARIFKRETGANFQTYLHRRRIARARELLAGTDWRIAEIAFACGFESIPHFNRIFRRIAGRSPRAERARATSDGRAADNDAVRNPS
jgi:AraC-like DNA-binding protein